MVTIHEWTKYAGDGACVCITLVVVVVVWWCYRAERQNKVKTKRGDAWAEWKGTDHSLWQIQIQHGAQQDITVDLRASFDDYLLHNWANEEPHMSRTRALERCGIRLVVGQMNGMDGNGFKSQRPGPPERARRRARGENNSIRKLDRKRKQYLERSAFYVVENEGTNLLMNFLMLLDGFWVYMATASSETLMRFCCVQSLDATSNVFALPWWMHVSFL